MPKRKASELDPVDTAVDAAWSSVLAAVGGDPQRLRQAVERLASRDGFMGTPGLGFPEGYTMPEVRTCVQVCQNIQNAVRGPLNSSGARSQGQRNAIHSVAAACCGTQGLPFKDVTAVTGLSREMQKQGITLAKTNSQAKYPSDVLSSVPISTPVTKIQWEKIWKWFHGRGTSPCYKVEVDKQTKRQYVR